MKVFLEAYGCTLNRGEAEEFEDELLQLGHEVVGAENEADAFVLFTCGVIETTERHMLKRIGQLSMFSGKRLLVCGCLGNICPEKIQRAAPHAIIFGTAEHRGGLELFGSEKAVGPEAKSHKSSVGILPIASGCAGACSYCITRKARGKLRSRTLDDVESRLNRLVSRGAAEIQICAQDTASYGRDVGAGLGTLIEHLEGTDGDFMMRIGMMSPASVLQNQEDVLEAYGSKKVFKFLHLPAQSGSDRILKAMNRRHTVREFKGIVNSFRARFPQLSLSTDIIVGFPGETEEDFRSSQDLVKDIGPDIINVTRFSSRPGTQAHAMKDKVPGKVAKERSKILTELRFELTAHNYDAMVGKTVRALATERRMEGTTFLRTENYKPAVVPEVLEPGAWYKVKIVGASRTHLDGVLER